MLNLFEPFIHASPKCFEVPSSKKKFSKQKSFENPLEIRLSCKFRSMNIHVQGRIFEIDFFLVAMTWTLNFPRSDIWLLAFPAQWESILFFFKI